jgi:calcineurin-like phosphoesterase family protein
MNITKLPMSNKLVVTENSKLFFTSDPHFWHHAIIDYASRPFNSLEEMHTALITNWNNVVPEDGKVIVVGDFAFTRDTSKIKSILDQLNGEIYLVMGNHDYQNGFCRMVVASLFADVVDYLLIKVMDTEVEDNSLNIYCNHYPMLTWPRRERGTVHVFGHLHTLPNRIVHCIPPTAYEVGVDLNNFTPVSYQQVKTIITKNLLK